MSESGTLERAYRLRAYPTRAQQRAIGRLTGASRFVWNWALARRSDAYNADETRLNWVALSRELTALKQTPGTKWLAGCNGPSAPPYLDEGALLIGASAVSLKAPRGKP